MIREATWAYILTRPALTSTTKEEGLALVYPMFAGIQIEPDTLSTFRQTVGKKLRARKFKTLRVVRIGELIGQSSPFIRDFSCSFSFVLLPNLRGFTICSDVFSIGKARPGYPLVHERRSLNMLSKVQQVFRQTRYGPSVHDRQ